jgi:hypothetical protein
MLMELEDQQRQEINLTATSVKIAGRAWFTSRLAKILCLSKGDVSRVWTGRVQHTYGAKVRVNISIIYA